MTQVSKHYEEAVIGADALIEFDDSKDMEKYVAMGYVAAFEDLGQIFMNTLKIVPSGATSAELARVFGDKFVSQVNKIASRAKDLGV